MTDMNEVKNNVLKYANLFNHACGNLSKFLIKEFPNNSDFYIYNDIMQNIAKNKPEEPISIFLENVYFVDEYRNSIINGDETFFKKDSLKNLTGDDKSKITAMFQFKTCWDQLGTDAHNYIKKSMNMLIKICDNYVTAKDKYNTHKK